MTGHEFEDEEIAAPGEDFAEDESAEDDEPELAGGGVARRLVAEFVGTFFLVLAMAMVGEPSAPVLVAATVATLFLLFGPVSGGHFNPVVTVASGLLGKIRAELLWIYLIAQFAAGFAAFALAWALRPPLDEASRAALRASVDRLVGANGNNVPWFPSGWPLLILLSALLVAAVLAARHKFEQQPVAGAWIGAAVGATYWLSESIYPAASLPDVVFDGYASAFRALPVLMFFPLIGAYLGALLYRELVLPRTAVPGGAAEEEQSEEGPEREEPEAEEEETAVEDEDSQSHESS